MLRAAVLVVASTICVHATSLPCMYLSPVTSTWSQFTSAVAYQGCAAYPNCSTSYPWIPSVLKTQMECSLQDPVSICESNVNIASSLTQVYEGNLDMPWTLAGLESTSIWVHPNSKSALPCGYTTTLAFPYSHVGSSIDCLRAKSWLCVCTEFATSFPTTSSPTSAAPNKVPSARPSTRPSRAPSARPSKAPTASPVANQTTSPSATPSKAPTTNAPLNLTQTTTSPSIASTAPLNSTASPSLNQTTSPSTSPSTSFSSLSANTSSSPTLSLAPSLAPTVQPSAQTTEGLSAAPNTVPSFTPSARPSERPSRVPSAIPLMQNDSQSTLAPVLSNNSRSSSAPESSSGTTVQPSNQPVSSPSNHPSQSDDVSQSPTLSPLDPERNTTLSPSQQQTEYESNATASPSSGSVLSARPSSSSSSPYAKPTAVPIHSSRVPTSSPLRNDASPVGGGLSTPSASPLVSSQPSSKPSLSNPPVVFSSSPTSNPSASVNETGQASYVPLGTSVYSTGSIVGMSLAGLFCLGCFGLSCRKCRRNSPAPRLRRASTRSWGSEPKEPAAISWIYITRPFSWFLTPPSPKKDDVSSIEDSYHRVTEHRRSQSFTVHSAYDPETKRQDAVRNIRHRQFHQMMNSLFRRIFASDEDAKNKKEDGDARGSNDTVILVSAQDASYPSQVPSTFVTLYDKKEETSKRDSTSSKSSASSVRFNDQVAVYSSEESEMI